MSESELINVLRIVDAAANRASEGLRAIEDYLRFALDNRFLATECKRLRHELVSALAGVSLADRLAARESQHDVGAPAPGETPSPRHDLLSTVAANFSRSEQALRSLEEYLKHLAPDASAATEKLRFRLYSLQKAADAAAGSSALLANVRLYVIVSCGATADEFEQLLQQLIDGGVGAIQLRDKQATDRVLAARARILVEMTRPRGVLSIVNDRPDIAAVAHSDGVHVGQDELTVKDARTIVGPRALVGVSTHSLDQARQAVLDGASYIGVGPTFPSDTKWFDSFPGLDYVRQVAEEIQLPAFCIGGITLENVSRVLAAGGRRIAVSKAISAAENPRLASQKFREMLESLPGTTSAESPVQPPAQPTG